MLEKNTETEVIIAIDICKTVGYINFSSEHPKEPRETALSCNTEDRSLSTLSLSGAS